MRSLLAFILCLLLTGLVSAQEDAQTPYEIALQRIEEAQERDFLRIDLAGLELDHLPPEIGQLTNVRQLWLHDNQLSSLPAEIGNLQNIEELTLFNNQLSELPPEIGQLSNLMVLRLSDNHFSSLPTTISELKLCFLDIRNNEFQQLQPEISQIDFLNNPCGEYNRDLLVEGNPLISPPQEVIEQGTPAILDYLRNPLLWHLRRFFFDFGFFSVAVPAVLTVCWLVYRSRGKKKKRE